MPFCVNSIFYKHDSDNRCIIQNCNINNQYLKNNNVGLKHNDGTMNKKCNKPKSPCKFCFKEVSPKTGLQCQGACRKWAHFSCLNYTPGKIHDIKAGFIKINCPCPDCETKGQKEEILHEPFTCTNEVCPANSVPVCTFPSCPSKSTNGPRCPQCPKPCPPMPPPPCSSPPPCSPKSSQCSPPPCQKPPYCPKNPSCPKTPPCQKPPCQKPPCQRPPSCKPPPCKPSPCGGGGKKKKKKQKCTSLSSSCSSDPCLPPPSCLPPPCPPPPCPPPPCPPPSCPPPPCQSSRPPKGKCPNKCGKKKSPCSFSSSSSSICVSNKKTQACRKKCPTGKSPSCYPVPKPPCVSSDTCLKNTVEDLCTTVGELTCQVKELMCRMRDI